MIKNKIWIDLDNSPHVLLFKPIITGLEKCGYDIFTTARDAFQVKDLLKQLDVTAKIIGRHHGKNKTRKITGLFIRANELLPSVKNFQPDLAVSHGSRAQMILSRLLGIKTILMLDYEFIQLILFFLPHYIIIPEVVPAERFMAKGIKVLHYPGIKEDVYLPNFIPDANILDELGFQDDHKIIITIRGPAIEAHYFVSQSQQLFETAVSYLSSLENVTMIILPRNKKQHNFIKAKWYDSYEQKKIILPEHAVDGLSLMWYSDLVISGGGTMNREAATLGVPVYSIFRGEIGAVDRYLSENGKLTLIRNQDDISSKFKIQKRIKKQYKAGKNNEALDSIIKSIQQIIGE